MEFMKPYHYIDENNAEQLDLIRLFEYAFEDADLTTNELIIALSKLEKYVTIKTKNENS
jgi:hypothetical protein